jgi:hypothetical protein
VAGAARNNYARARAAGFGTLDSSGVLKLLEPGTRP